MSQPISDVPSDISSDNLYLYNIPQLIQKVIGVYAHIWLHRRIVGALDAYVSYTVNCSGYRMYEVSASSPQSARLGTAPHRIFGMQDQAFHVENPNAVMSTHSAILSSSGSRKPWSRARDERGTVPSREDADAKVRKACRAPVKKGPAFRIPRAWFRSASKTIWECGRV